MGCLVPSCGIPPSPRSLVHARAQPVRAARYWGPWSFSPATFSNAYYKNLLEYSPYPHQDPTGSRNCTSTLECARGFSGRRGKAGPVSCPSPAFRFRPLMRRVPSARSDGHARMGTLGCTRSSRDVTCAAAGSTGSRRRRTTASHGPDRRSMTALWSRAQALALGVLWVLTLGV